MISRFVYNTCCMLSYRNLSINPQVNWTLYVKFNSLTECKLYHTSAVCFKTKKNLSSSYKKNDKEKEDTSHFKVLKVWKDITVREIANVMNMSIRDLGLLMPNLRLRADDAISSPEIICEALHKCGWKLQVVKKPKKEKNVGKKGTIQQNLSSADPKNLVKRPPVVTVMGHVDHGKTTLLDSLRNTFVAQQEFGGITQHIGAFSVEVKPGDKITFIDTPGHAAFTTMRSRGAEVTDLVVLVIAADDGIMEQTLESIKIAKLAEVPIIVAVNKIDKPTAQPIEKIKQGLLLEGVQVEDKGGDIQLVPISALKKINLDLLTEMILLQAELMGLKGDPTGLVEGVIIESKRGPAGIVATLIVKRGTLCKEKILVAGRVYARVRRMLDENGKDYKDATPSTPVQVLGWREFPSAGDPVIEVKTEKQAKSIISELERKAMAEKRESEKGIIEQKQVEHKRERNEYQETKNSFSTWKERNTFFFQYNQQKLKEQKMAEATGPQLKILLKGDVYGSLEVLMEVLDSYNKQDECKLSVVNASVGDIKPADLEMAASFDALIYAFNVGMHEQATELLTDHTVDIRYHNVLYKLIDDIKEELNKRIPPKDEEEIQGEAEVLQNFLITHGKKKVPVAGSRCVKGQLNKDSLYKILRDGQVIYEGKLEMMKNEKVIVKTISKGMHCGLMFESFSDNFQPGDKIICYDMIKVTQKTSWDPGF